MKRFFAFLLVGLMTVLLVMPAAAQDATAEATPEAVKYDPAACFVAAKTNDKMVKLEAKTGPF
ncbi:MAG: hypothetical protein ABI970_04385, partial [Chloroflexota bacterium]